MKPRGSIANPNPAVSAWSQPRQPQIRPSHLYLVTACELQTLRESLTKSMIPPDLEAKLVRLAAGEITHSFIEQNCRTIIEMLVAAHDGSFKHLTASQREHLLKVLAYVRKDDDGIPDYRPNGYSDDQQEVRAALLELMPTLQAFKAWRLKHQVPAMW